MSMKAILLACVFSLPTFADEYDSTIWNLSPSHPGKMVMSFDGGGIRGIFSLKVLDAVIDGLPYPLHRYVDLFAGTSTGGIIALALAIEKPIEDVLKLYTEKGNDVFYSSFWHNIKSLCGLVDERYGVEKFEPLLQEFYGKDTKLSNITKTDALAIAFDVTAGTIKELSTFTARKNPQEDINVWLAARCTSAAPTYFEPVDWQGHAIIDGGVVANNPGEQAALLMKQQYGLEVFNTLNTISIGTGTYYDSYTFPELKTWGIAQWAAPISSIMMNAVSNKSHNNMKTFYPSENQYIRLNTSLKRDIPLDSITARDVEEIQTAALTYIQNNPQAIDQARKMLLKNGIKPQ